MKKIELNSFLKHPDLRHEHKNKESKQLTHHTVHDINETASQSTHAATGDLSPGGSLSTLGNPVADTL